MTTTVSADIGVRISAADIDLTDDPSLVWGRHATCGVAFYPTLDRCAWCWPPHARRALRHTSTLSRYSIVHIGPRGRQVPYTVRYVDLPGDMRVFAHVNEDRPRCDMPVSLDLSPGPDGHLAAGVPVASEGSRHA